MNMHAMTYTLNLSAIFRNQYYHIFKNRSTNCAMRISRVVTDKSLITKSKVRYILERIHHLHIFPGNMSLQVSIAT